MCSKASHHSKYYTHQQASQTSLESIKIHYQDSFHVIIAQKTFVGKAIKITSFSYFTSSLTSRHFSAHLDRSLSWLSGETELFSDARPLQVSMLMTHSILALTTAMLTSLSLEHYELATLAFTSSGHNKGHGRS